MGGLSAERGRWVRGGRGGQPCPALKVSAVIQHQGTGPPGGHQGPGEGALLWKGCSTELRSGRHCTGSQEVLHGHFQAIAFSFLCGLLACAAPLGREGWRAHPGMAGPGRRGTDLLSQPTGQLSFYTRL